MRQSYVIRVRFYSRVDLKSIRKRNERLSTRIIELLKLADDIPVDLARDHRVRAGARGIPSQQSSQGRAGRVDALGFR